jgi:hypothetical protein
MHSGNSKAQILALLVGGVIQERIIFDALPKPQKNLHCIGGVLQTGKKNS